MTRRQPNQGESTSYLGECRHLHKSDAYVEKQAVPLTAIRAAGKSRRQCQRGSKVVKGNRTVPAELPSSPVDGFRRARVCACTNGRAFETRAVYLSESADRDPPPGNHTVTDLGASKSSKNTGSRSVCHSSARRKPRPPRDGMAKQLPPSIVPSIKPLQAIQEALAGECEAGNITGYYFGGHRCLRSRNSMSLGVPETILGTRPVVGEAAGLIRDVWPAERIVEGMVAQAEGLLRSGAQHVRARAI
jgi:hypothetical protein